MTPPVGVDDNPDPSSDEYRSSLGPLLSSDVLVDHGLCSGGGGGGGGGGLVGSP